MAATSSRKGWSSSTLGEAVLWGCLPMLVRLEEGFCGPDEGTSMSLGDVLALQSSMVVNNCRVVIAYYKSDMSVKDESDDGEEVETYRALIALPLDNADIASLRITTFPDPGGITFANYVTGLFADCNWIGREKELFVSMAPMKKDKKRPPTSSVREQSNGFGLPPFGNPTRGQSLPPQATTVTSDTAEKMRSKKLLTLAASTSRRRRGLPPCPVGESSSISSFKSERKVPSQSQVSLRRSTTEVKSSAKNLVSRLSSFLSINDAKWKKQGKEDPDSSENEYEEIDEGSLEAYQHDYSRLGKVEGKQSSTPGVRKHTTGRVDVLSGYKFAGGLTRGVEGRYVNHPHSSGASLRATSTPLAEMSVRELCACLEECRMSDLAAVCSRLAIDGMLLCSLSEDVLQAKPFLLSQYLLEKWRCVKNGWRPKLV